MERLTAGPLESQRLLVPMVLDLAPSAHAGAGRPRGRARAARLRDRARSATRTIKVTAVPALLEHRGQREGAARARRGSRGARPRRAGAGRAAAHRGDHRVPCGGEGELPADLREDDAHPRRAARDRVFDRLSARPPGDAAADAARDREELRSDLKCRHAGHRLTACATEHRLAGLHGVAGRRMALVFYAGARRQLIGMWLLLVDVSLRPARWARIRACSRPAWACFLAGWGLTRLTRLTPAACY